jgi:hypothetical protein
VRADLLDPYDALLKINGDDQPIVVTLDVEHDQQHIELVVIEEVIRPRHFSRSKRKHIQLRNRTDMRNIILRRASIFCVFTQPGSKPEELNETGRDSTQPAPVLWLIMAAEKESANDRGRPNALPRRDRRRR